MASEPPVSPETPTPAPEKKSHTGLIITIVLIVIVVLLALFFGLYFGLRNNEPDTPEEVNPDPDIVEPGPEEEPEHTHEYGDWQYDDTYHWKECECGDIIDKEEHTLGYTDNNDSETHTIYCEICEYETAGEHTWSVTSSTPATCTEDGATYYECEFCNATKTTTIAALGHDWSSEWSYDDTYHWHVCTVCGEVEPESKVTHTSAYRDNNDGTHTQYCSVCNYEIKTESHDIEYTQITDDETNHTESCKYCDYTATVAHTFDGYVSDGENGHHQVCSECEYTTNDESHDLSYVSVNDTYHHQVCSECTYTTDSTKHDYQETIITIENLGEAADSITATYEYTCTECEHTKTEANQPYTLNFANDPWNVIDQVSSAGYAKTYYSVSDTKTITIGEVEYDIRIIDFDHDDLSETDSKYGDFDYNGGSNKAAITCEMVDIMNLPHNMNSNDTNSGGWDRCEMRSYLNSDEDCVLSTLDSELQSVIKMVDKYTTAGNKSTTITTSSDKLFLLSKTEYYTNTSAGYKDEGTQYAYWSEHTNSSDRIKGTPYTWPYWLRSPYTTSTTYFCYVSDTGSLGTYGNSPTTRNYLSFAFCV